MLVTIIIAINMYMKHIRIRFHQTSTMNPTVRCRLQCTVQEVVLLLWRAPSSQVSRYGSNIITIVDVSLLLSPSEKCWTQPPQSKHLLLSWTAPYGNICNYLQAHHDCICTCTVSPCSLRHSMLWRTIITWRTRENIYYLPVTVLAKYGPYVAICIPRPAT